MNDQKKYVQKKYVFRCLFASATLLFAASFQPAWAQAPALGAASSFSVLGGANGTKNVTCTAPGVITGDVGVFPGGTFTNTTGCIIASGSLPATDAAAALALAPFLNAYADLQSRPCTHMLPATLTPAPGPLAPGVYCFDAPGVAFTNTTLTLDGSSDANGVWIFQVGAALTGTSFSVVMTNSGQACNVFWAVGAAVTLTTSVFQGNILAGDPINGSISSTDGSLVGRAFANVAVTLTRPNLHGTCALLAQAGGSCCHHKDCDGEKDKCCDRDKDKDCDGDRAKDKHIGKDCDKEKDKDQHQDQDD
jgi:hypothetical protein